MKPIKTKEDIKEQIKRACQVFSAYQLPFPGDLQSSLGSLLPTENEQTEIYFSPTPQDIDDADIVQFQWMPILLPKESRLLWERFSGLSWKQVAFNFKISERTARYRAAKAINKLFYTLTNQHCPPPPQKQPLKLHAIKNLPVYTLTQRSSPPVKALEHTPSHIKIIKRRH